VLEVLAHGADRDEEPSCDVGITQPVGDEPQDI
jgi:hypothetical protein